MIAALDRSIELGPRGLTGVLLLALILSLCMTGLHQVMRRAFSDPLPLLAGLMFLSSVASMTVAAGYLGVSSRPSAPSVAEFIGFSPGRDSLESDRERSLAWAFTRMADADGDGVTSAAEASRLSARLVTRASPSRVMKATSPVSSIPSVE
ncbi:hypothetical protein EP7_005540 (plasmid) [Isosphaeraceae bacterium EP7]